MKREPSQITRTGIASRGWAPLIAFAMLGVGAWALYPGHFISDDSYFYPVVARNIVLEGIQSFSGVIPTNGVHPLWLYVLTAYSGLVAQLDPELLWRTGYAVPLSAVLLGWGALSTWQLAREIGQPPLLFSAIPLTYLIALGVLYSEAHLHYALLTTLLLLLARGGVESPAGMWRVGLASAGLFLARLDAVFVVGSCLAGHLLTAKRPVRVLGAAAIAALPAIAYMASNSVFFGGVTPVSGWMKSTFPQVFWKGWMVGGREWMGNSVPFGIVPLAAALLLFALRPRISERRDRLMVSLLTGALLQSAYIALFTRSHTGWYWYYVPHVLLAAFVACEVPRRIPWLRRAVTPLALGVLAAGTLVVFHQAGTSDLSPAQKAILEFVEEAEIRETGLLVSDWPGHIAFHTDNPIFAIDMLTTSQRFYEEMSRAPRPIELVLQRFREAGRPLEYLIWEGNKRLATDRDRQRVVFHDPRAMPDLRPFDQLAVPEGPLSSAPDGLVVWRIAP